MRPRCQGDLLPLVQINWRKTFLFMYRYHMDKRITDIQYKNINSPASYPVSCRYTRQLFMSPLPYYSRGTLLSCHMWATVTRHLALVASRRSSLLPSEVIGLAFSLFGLPAMRHFGTMLVPLYIQQLTRTFGDRYSMATGQTEAMLQQYGYPTLFFLHQNCVTVHLPTAAP